MRLRQIALAATDLEGTVAALREVFGLGAHFRDPGVAEFGLDNAVFAVGETFLEVVSPVRDDASARRWIERRGGDSGYMVILQCDDHATLGAEVERAQAAGARQVWEGEHRGARTVHFHPRDLGAILSFDAMPEWDDWVWAGPDWRTRGTLPERAELRAACLESPEPRKLAARWAATLGLEVDEDGAAPPQIALPRGGRLVFQRSDAESDGLAGVEIFVGDRSGCESRAHALGLLDAQGVPVIAGTRFTLLER